MNPPALLASLCLVLQTPHGDTAPPGLVFVAGGRTTIGSKVGEIEDLIRRRPELYLAVPGETPQFTQGVADFWLMPSEVTNEQYEAYVRATGAKPPRSWGASALREGQQAFLEEQARARAAAVAAGKPFEAGGFDPDAWWREHWQGAAYEVPAAEHANPVVFVDFYEAEHYARWAGLRLMSEFEYARAGRGDSARAYPWGEGWDDKKFCQSLHSGREASAPVGSFPAGAVGGIHDLSGNVWEWTASPFTAFPGYKPLRVELKDKRVVEGFGPFDPQQRVVVGGSFQTDRDAVRLALRKNVDKSQATNALGFRCAASPQPGLDSAQWIVTNDIHGVPTPWKLAATVAQRRWTTEAGEAKVAGYRVIRGYEEALLCPAESLAIGNASELAAESHQDGPLFVGFVVLPHPVTAPALAAGLHLVAWRGAGAAPRPASTGAGGETSYADVPGFDATKDCFVLCDAGGKPEVALGAPPVVVARAKACVVALEPAAAGASEDHLRFTLCVPSSRAEPKGFFFELALPVAAGSLGDGWR